MYNGIKVIPVGMTTLYTLEESDSISGLYRCAWESGGNICKTDFNYFEEQITEYLERDTWRQVMMKEEQGFNIDKGKHYRYAFRLNLTQEDIESGFVMVNVDPYRISEVYNLGGWREHLVKKAIRGTEKGHTEDELLEELQCTLDRAKQMLEESRE